MCAFKNYFSTLQCNPSKPICPTKDFLLDNSGQKLAFLCKFNELLQKRANPCARQMAKDINMSMDSLRTIFKSDLQMLLYKMRKRQYLIPAQNLT